MSAGIRQASWIPLPRYEKGQRTAVLLNANARRVNSRLQKRLEAIVPRGDLYRSHDLEEAREQLTRILHRGYERVLVGGGDGTFCSTVNLLDELVRNHFPHQRLPQLGVLKLGTGNALAHFVGAGAPLRQIEELLNGRRYGVVRLPLIDDGTHLTPLAGVGWDAAILNDYRALKNRFQGRLGRVFFQSLFGYLFAIATRTIPRELVSGHRLQVRVRNIGEALHLVPGGRPLPVPRGTLLFEGPCKLAGVATMPFFGYGFRAFPFARIEQRRMQLRIATCSVAETLGHLPSIWRGGYRSPSLLDFLVEAVEIEMDEPEAYQSAGEACGLRKKLRFTLSDRWVELLDYRL